MSEARTFLVGAGPCEAPRLAQLAVLTEQGQCRRDGSGCSEGLLEAFEQRKAVAWFYVVKTRPVVRARSGRRGNATAHEPWPWPCALHLPPGWAGACGHEAALPSLGYGAWHSGLSEREVTQLAWPRYLRHT